MSGKHIFISYSRDDKTTMQRIKMSLMEFGIEVWTDEGIEVGTSNWQLAIEKAIEECHSLVCILTPSAKQSQWVREELVYATFHGKPVYMIHARGDYKQVAILGFTVAQLIDVRDADVYMLRMAQLCKRILDELRGQNLDDAHKETGRLNEFPSPSPDELPQSQTEEIVSKFLPASLKQDEHHVLIVQQGKEVTKQSVFNLEHTFMTIGRESSNTIQIEDDSVSRAHCQLIYTNEGFLVRDTGSTNGTFVNAERVKLRGLKHSDVIQIGTYVSLRYTIRHDFEENTLPLNSVQADSETAPARLPDTDKVGDAATEAKPTQKMIFDMNALFDDNDNTSKYTPVQDDDSVTD